MNLAVNARDAMPNGGRLLIETRDVYLDEDYADRNPEVRPGPHILISMSDVGHGMDRETLARIFDPFFTTKGLGHGTGLGLAMVYGIVKQHGGHITVYSEEGKGTVFKIYFFSAAEEEVAPVVSRTSIPVLSESRETILVVEDERLPREMAARMLEAHGYEVLTARDAKSALEIDAGAESPVNLLLTDVVLPGVDGRELAKELTARRPRMGVIFMSGYTENSIVHRGVLEEGVNFLQKPFSMNSLIKMVQVILGKEES